VPAAAFAGAAFAGPPLDGSPFDGDDMLRTSTTMLNAVNKDNPVTIMQRGIFDLLIWNEHNFCTFLPSEHGRTHVS
jgi:hypothetical protein